MNYTLINSNYDHKALDLKISELIYQLESKNIQVQNIILRQLDNIHACEEVHQMLFNADLAIYICPLDSKKSLDRLKNFLEHYKKKHPPIYLILDADRLLEVEEVQSYLDDFEAFALKHQCHIVNVEYFEDAKAALI